jgi:dienelactone hydrolase
MQRCWQQASQLFDPPFEPVRIPYGGSFLPGYLLRQDTRTVRRPTVILNNGEDAQNDRLYAYGGAAALERGYNALIFEGPGQGSVLFQRQVPFRPDWENVITPVVDYLRSRPDVDPSRIALSGSSLGGELVIRAAAFEHRLAAVIADPGILSVWLSWTTGFPELGTLFASGASKQEINAAWTKKIVPAFNAVDRFEVPKRAEGYGRPFLLAARAGQVFADLFYQFTEAEGAQGSRRAAGFLGDADRGHRRPHRGGLVQDLPGAASRLGCLAADREHALDPCRDAGNR